MTDNEIIKALECCTLSKQICPKNCPLANDRGCMVKVKENALDLINRQKAEIERLEYVLLGVMHSVDKWLDDKELEQDEVNRAATMREKTLQIVETAKAEAIKEFAERLIARCGAPHWCVWMGEISEEMEEMVGDDNENL